MQDLNNKAINDELSASEWNGTRTEVQNIIEDSGITLSAGDLRQLAKAITNSVATADFYTDSGTANAHVLSVTNSNSAPTAYKDGMRVRYYVNVTNTSAVTVNVEGLGVKSIFYSGTVQLAGRSVAGEKIEAIYNLSDDRFDIVITSDVSKIKMNGFRLDHGVFNGDSFSATSETTLPSDVKFRPDGLSAFVLGGGASAVYQYTLTRPFRLSSSTYASKSFDVTTQDSLPQSIEFKPDGLTMFMVGATNDTVYQYTLSTAWDISTASYASKSVDISTEEDAPVSIFVRDDGLKMFVIGLFANRVSPYTLSTAWDASTATYDGANFNVNTQDTSPSSVAFKSDGLIMYVSGKTTDAIYQYSLSTAWDVTTASYDNISLNILPENFTINTITLKPNGEFIFTLDQTTDDISSYSINFLSLTP